MQVDCEYVWRVLHSQDYQLFPKSYLNILKQIYSNHHEQHPSSAHLSSNNPNNPSSTRSAVRDRNPFDPNSGGSENESARSVSLIPAIAPELREETISKLVDKLLCFPPFSGVNASNLTKVLSNHRVTLLKAREGYVLYPVKTELDSIYVILAGRVSIYEPNSGLNYQTPTKTQSNSNSSSIGGKGKKKAGNNHSGNDGLTVYPEFQEPSASGLLGSDSTRGGFGGKRRGKKAKSGDERFEEKRGLGPSLTWQENPGPSAQQLPLNYVLPPLSLSLPLSVCVFAVAASQLYIVRLYNPCCTHDNPHDNSFLVLTLMTGI